MIERPLSPETREENLAQMADRDRPLDLLVIGGGITGVGIARDAAHRGLSVGLVERRDFASGTSSRSSKLIHGGVRYLQLGDFGLVRESAAERSVLGRIAPHLAHPTLMVIPAHNRRAHLALNAGLWTYEKLGSIDANELHTMWDREETLARVPLLRPERLYGAATHYESITDDARLVLDTLKDAHTAGALVANYAEVTQLHVERSRVGGARVRNIITGSDCDIEALVVVNAAGPWVDAVRSLEGPLPPKRLHLTKGVHLILPRTCLPVDHIVVFTAGDRRSVFVVPRGEVIYTGTTDTDYGGPADRPEITAEDADYLLTAINRAFVTPGVGPEMIVSAWAGLRPLLHEEGKAPSEISRKDEIMVGQKGLVSIAGGKLTTYRRMAERVVDLAVKSLDRSQGMHGQIAACQTDKLPLAGGDCSREELRALESRLGERYPEIPPATIARVVAKYGTQSETLLDPIADSPDFGEPVATGTVLLRAEIRYAIEHEMALTVEDVLDRRTQLLLFSLDQGLGAVDGVAEMLAERLGWNTAHTESETATYRVLAESLLPGRIKQEPAKTGRAVKSKAATRSRSTR